MKKGVLLINLGTPDDASPQAVKRFLTEFLTDKRVISLPLPLRHFLVRGLIIPLRLKKVSHAYESIGLPEGMPLRLYTQQIVDKLNHIWEKREDITFAFGMRYGSPSISTALDKIKDCDQITVLPLYPHYTGSTTVSALDALFSTLETDSYPQQISIIRHFYQNAAYISALSSQIQPYLVNHEFLLLSYHGIPQNQNDATSVRYQQQCLQTSALLAKALQLKEGQYTSAFQSRLGPLPWIQPYTDEVLKDLAQKGVKRLAIVCPSFITDCLETLEEIAIRAKEQWLSLGGETLTAIPCLNASDAWIQAIAKIAQLH